MPDRHVRPIEDILERPSPDGRWRARVRAAVKFAGNFGGPR
jgi:hypothetical protein